MKPITVVVADSTRARFFLADSIHSSLDEVETMVNPEGRMREQDLVSDMPGKSRGKGGGGDHAFQEKVEPKKEEMIGFAKRIAEHLDTLRKNNDLHNLYLISAPAFLGELRHHLSKETSETIVFELDKNLAHHDENDISKHLAHLTHLNSYRN